MKFIKKTKKEEENNKVNTHAMWKTLRGYQVLTRSERKKLRKKGINKLFKLTG